MFAGSLVVCVLSSRNISPGHPSLFLCSSYFFPSFEIQLFPRILGSQTTVPRCRGSKPQPPAHSGILMTPYCSSVSVFPAMPLLDAICYLGTLLWTDFLAVTQAPNPICSCQVLSVALAPGTQCSWFLNTLHCPSALEGFWCLRMVSDVFHWVAITLGCIFISPSGVYNPTLHLLPHSFTEKLHSFLLAQEGHQLAR